MASSRVRARSEVAAASWRSPEPTPLAGQAGRRARDGCRGSRRRGGPQAGRLVGAPDRVRPRALGRRDHGRGCLAGRHGRGSGREASPRSAGPAQRPRPEAARADRRGKRTRHLQLLGRKQLFSSRGNVEANGGERLAGHARGDAETKADVERLGWPALEQEAVMFLSVAKRSTRSPKRHSRTIPPFTTHAPGSAAPSRAMIRC